VGLHLDLAAQGGVPGLLVGLTPGVDALRQRAQALVQPTHGPLAVSGLLVDVAPQVVGDLFKARQLGLKRLRRRA
jgi:hypothetical protein